MLILKAAAWVVIVTGVIALGKTAWSALRDLDAHIPEGPDQE